MRQIRPRTPTIGFLSPPLLDVIVDLRPERRPPQDEQELRTELEDARSAVNSAVLGLSELIDRRENLKTRLAALAGGERAVPADAARTDDPTIVAWGFYEDDDL